MVDVVQLVLNVVGSSPTLHPKTGILIQGFPFLRAIGYE